MPIRILIVEDHPAFQAALRTVMSCCQPGSVEVVGEAADGASAIELASRLHPDIVTMDIGLPDMSGLEVTRELKAKMPQLEVIVITMHDDEEHREAAKDAGATSYITKDRLMQELLPCLDRLVSRGNVQVNCKMRK